MAGLALSVNGRLATGETLQVWVLGSPTGLQWQALVNGAWTNVGTANSQTYVIPANAAGLSYRVMGTSADGTFFTTATGPAITDSKKASAPVLSGPAYSSIGTEDPGQRSVFSWLAVSDADKVSFGGGSLLFSDSTSTLYGGDGHDVLSIRFLGTAAGQFSYAAATREVKYAFTNPNGSISVTTVGTIDATLNGNGTDLKVVFNNNATQAVLDALVDNLQFSNNDDSPTFQRLLTLRITDPTGASAQRVTSASIENTPDAPVFTSAAAFAVNENQTAVGTLAAVDPDREAAAPQGIAFSLATGQGDGDNARFTIDAASGALNFIAAPDFEDAMHAPQYSVRVRATDSDGSATEQAVVVSLRNVNDAPVAAPLTSLVLENGAPVRIAAHFSDPDAGDTLTVAFNATGTIGAVTLDGASFVYDPAGRFESLAAGQRVNDTFSYTVTDAAGLSSTQTVMVTVVGQNDAATISGGPTSGVLVDEAGTQNSVLTVGGQFTVTDPDQGESRLAVRASTLSAYGIFSTDASGHWTYTANNTRLQSLGEGLAVVERFTVASADGTAARDVQVTLQGTNDAPTMFSIGSGYAIEAGASSPGIPTVSGHLYVQDPDANDTFTFSVPGSGLFGQLAVDGDGNWLYTLDNQSAATQALSNYNWGTEHFTVRVTDAHGAGAQQDVSITVMGANDAPVIVASDSTGVVHESAPDGRLVLTSGAAHGPNSATADAAGRLLLLGDTAFPEPSSTGGQGGPLENSPPVSVGLPPAHILYRFNADGSTDRSFGGTGSIRVDAGFDKLAIDANGGYVLGNNGTPLVQQNPATFDFAATRYLANGALDSGFGTNGVAVVDFDGGSDALKQVIAMAGGKLLLAGTTQVDGGSELALARLSADGSLDATFGNAGKEVLILPGEHTGGYHVVADADGGFTLWTQTTVAGTGEKLVHLARLLADGGMDTSFGNVGSITFSLGTWYANTTAGIAIDDAGHIVLGWGKFDYDSPVGYRPMLTRFDADGTLDTSFGEGGTADTQLGVRYGSTFGLNLDAQGHVLLVPDLPTPSGAQDFMLARFNADGSRDTSFGVDGVVSTDLGGADHAGSAFALAGGDIVVAGHSSQMYASELAAFVRYNTDGSLEQGFGGPPDEEVHGMLQAQDPDGFVNLWWSGGSNGVYGRLTVDSGGSWTYRLDNSRAATQGLEEGQSVTETFVATVRDDWGATATQQIVVTVIGVDDVPVS